MWQGLVRPGLGFKRTLFIDRDRTVQIACAIQNVLCTVRVWDFLTKPNYYLVANRNVAYIHTHTHMMMKLQSKCEARREEKNHTKCSCSAARPHCTCYRYPLASRSPTSLSIYSFLYPCFPVCFFGCAHIMSCILCFTFRAFGVAYYVSRIAYWVMGTLHFAYCVPGHLWWHVVHS